MSTISGLIKTVVEMSGNKITAAEARRVIAICEERAREDAADEGRDDADNQDLMDAIKSYFRN